MKHLQVQIYMNGLNLTGRRSNRRKLCLEMPEKCSFVPMSAFISSETESLSRKTAGSVCRIASIGSARLSLFLSEFGILPGSILHVVSKMPGKGPVALESGDFRFCIRFEDADIIRVESVS
jgi:Fe2+ transport system protein FeoA